MAESGCLNEVNYNHERGLSNEFNNRLDCHAIARNDVKNLCHPELGATHEATCVNVGDICNAYLKSFSGSINADVEPLTRISNAHIHSQRTAPSPTRGEGKKENSLAASLLSRLAAFTLAEVLITLGIIGVVAAMTMPSLINAKQEKATISIIKKNYSIFSNAILMAQNDNGELYTWGITQDEDGLNLISSNLKPYLKIIEDCGVGEKSDCAPGDNGKFEDLDGNKRSENFSSDDYYSFRLNDGSAIAIQLRTKDVCDSPEANCVNFFIDTNGNKSPNVLGKDIFYFAGYGNGKLLPAGVGHSPSETGWASSQGWFATAWAMYKENLDYLRCPDKLEWNGKSTCK